MTNAANEGTIEFRAGASTIVRLTKFKDGNFVAAPDVYASCVRGLWNFSQRIAVRGLKSHLLPEERRIEVASSRLVVEDSDSLRGRMTIGYMVDLLEGLSEALYSGLWFSEAEIEIFDRATQKHVGHGTLDNRYTPRYAVAPYGGGNSTATG